MDTPKIVFIDIDWTLYDHKNNEFNRSGIDALKSLQKKGALIYLASARNYHSIKHLGTFKVLHPDGMVVTNGATIFSHHKLIHSSYFSNDNLIKIIDIANNYHYSLECITDKSRFMATPIYPEVKELYSTFKEITVKYHKYKNQKVVTCLLFAREKDDKYIKEQLPDNIIYYRFDPVGVDLDPEPIDKGRGVKYVLDYLGIDKKDAIAIGDDTQDIPMFKEVGFSICLGNAKEEVKKEASYVTTEIWNDGVESALHNLKLI